jgi:hypothetical protein
MLFNVSRKVTEFYLSDYMAQIEDESSRAVIFPERTTVQYGSAVPL